MTSSFRLIAGIFIFLCGLPPFASAQTFGIDARLGHARATSSDVSVSRADNGLSDEVGVYDVSGIYFSSIGGLQTGFMSIRGLSTDDAPADSQININSVDFSYLKSIKLKPLRFELEAGALFANVETEFAGRQLEDEEYVSPFVGARLLIPLHRIFALQAGWRYVNDIAGGNLNIYQAGVRFSF